MTHTLPYEIIAQIVQEAHTQRDDTYARLRLLRTLRQVATVTDHLTLKHLYQSVPFSGPHAFHRFLEELRRFPARGLHVKELDFSAFTSVGLGRSRNCNKHFTMLTSATLRECLLLCPNIERVFLSEAVENDMDATVMHTLFNALPKLTTLDFCGADAPSFVAAMVASGAGGPLNVRHLSLHNCSTLPSTFFDDFLPRLTQVEQLDLYNTKVSGTALRSLPVTASLHGLVLSQCVHVAAADLTAFIMEHAASTQLERFDLHFSWNKTHPFETHPTELDLFCAHLPRQLTSLNVSGVELTTDHLTLLPQGLMELGAHDIELTGEVAARLPKLEYLLLSTNVISSEVTFANILTTLFPRLALLECPGFARLHIASSLQWEKIEGRGRRDWLRRRGVQVTIEGARQQWHARKLNLAGYAPRGLYEYYAYRI
ncbi:hypothetical protein BCR37DRAFT_384777 [Protomyces lactucae-debilis]|uniref:F-box domain-containing protein n=1 Tax=Protomyces lactucae-debilis TaxID=2754530 RepID=A0A1Y2EPE7_PROLT|nr:uncharacterized protein BCR37DRAFT_384777 [Protomyces lactucae-debilis]ORY73461.1 hypothetical protein BCR37DRAFT_384777 [Protomyces lactucae-debilis]